MDECLLQFGDETQFRYFIGPKIKRDVAAYNSYFDATGADLIIMPSVHKEPEWPVVYGSVLT